MLTEFEKLMVGLPVCDFVETKPTSVECECCHFKLCVKYSLREKYGSSYYYQCQRKRCQAFAIEDEKTWALSWFDVKGNRIK